MRIGLIGCGKWGQNIRLSLQQLGESVLVCDPLWEDPATPELIHQLCESVCIATPIDTHYEITKYWLNCKKNVFVEKPMSKTVVQVEELQQLAKLNGVVLMEDLLLRYHPVYKNITSDIVVCNRDGSLWDVGPHAASIANLVDAREAYFKSTSERKSYFSFCEIVDEKTDEFRKYKPLKRILFEFLSACEKKQVGRFDKESLDNIKLLTTWATSS